MLAKRVIPCLDVRDGKLTKGIKFAHNVDIGDPVESARKYYEEGADEIVFYDITASAETRKIFIDVVERVASTIFIPFSVGGGISSVDDMHEVLTAGAEKISSNSEARPSWWAWTSCRCRQPPKFPPATRSSSMAAANAWGLTP